MHETDLIDGIDLRKITRVTVVSDNGREFEKFGLYESGVVLSVQDEGRTLKLFPREVFND